MARLGGTNRDSHQVANKKSPASEPGRLTPLYLPTKISLLAFSAAIALSTIACADHDHPNLVIIMTYDQGYADVDFNGCEDIPTPNIDRIAQDPARFDPLGTWNPPGPVK